MCYTLNGNLYMEKKDFLFALIKQIIVSHDNTPECIFDCS